MNKVNSIFYLFVALVFWSFHSPHVIRNNNWGFFGHKKINELAIYGLPDEMFLFYKQHADYLIEHSVDPDKRRYAVKNEAACHYIDLDQYYCHQHPPQHMPLYWKDAICQFDEDSLWKHGIVPWQVQKKLSQLTEAFLSKNKNRILQISAELGHYIGDAHVPLHTCSNYNGQKTGQKGIHGLWESRLPELHFDRYIFHPQPAQFIEQPASYIWQAIYESHACVDSVLSIEKKLQLLLPEREQKTFEIRGNTETFTYSKRYSFLYHRALNGQIERQMKKAIACITHFWYTAWVNAGQPDLKTLDPRPWQEFLEKENAIHIREHDQ